MPPNVHGAILVDGSCVDGYCVDGTVTVARHALACGFAPGDDVGCVTAEVMLAQLDTRTQELFEQLGGHSRLGGHSKGRGFSAEVFSRYGPQSRCTRCPRSASAQTSTARRCRISASIRPGDAVRPYGVPRWHCPLAGKPR